MLFVRHLLSHGASWRTFDFLGFRIKRVPRPGRAPVAVTFPSDRALGDIKHRIKMLTSSSTVNLSLDELICALNPVLRGWTNYHRHNAAKRCFGYLSYYLWWRVIRWLRRKYPRLTWKQIKRRYWGRKWTSPEGRRLHWPAEVPVTRYRGRRKPSPWASPRNRPGHHPAGDRRCLTSINDRPADVLRRAGCSGMGMSGSVGGGEETISRKADPAPRRRPNHPRTIWLIHAASSFNDSDVQRCNRQL